MTVQSGVAMGHVFLLSMFQVSVRELHFVEAFLWQVSHSACMRVVCNVCCVCYWDSGLRPSESLLSYCRPACCCCFHTARVLKLSNSTINIPHASAIASAISWLRPCSAVMLADAQGGIPMHLQLTMAGQAFWAMTQKGKRADDLCMASSRESQHGMNLTIIVEGGQDRPGRTGQVHPGPVSCGSKAVYFVLHG